MHLLLKPHQSLSHLLDLLIGERAALHAANCLAFEQLSQELDQPQHQLGQPLLDVLWRTVDTGAGAISRILPIDVVVAPGTGLWYLIHPRCVSSRNSVTGQGPLMRMPKPGGT